MQCLILICWKNGHIRVRENDVLHLGLDISEIVSKKIDENNRKYPVEKAYGKADKYTSYTSDGGKGK